MIEQSSIFDRGSATTVVVAHANRSPHISTHPPLVSIPGRHQPRCRVVRRRGEADRARRRALRAQLSQGAP